MASVWSKRILVVLALQILQPRTAGIRIYDFPSPLVAGTRALIKYTNGDESRPASIILIKNTPFGEKYVMPVTTNAIGGNHTWALPDYLVNGEDYGLAIFQDGADGSTSSAMIAGGKSPGSSSTSEANHAPTGTSQSTTTRSTQSPQSTSESSKQQEPGKQGLNPSIAIGVGIGAAVLFIALLASLIFVCYRWRNLRAEKRKTPMISKPSYYGSSVQLVDNPMERARRSRHEKDSQTGLGELGTSANSYEVAGNTRSLRYELW